MPKTKKNKTKQTKQATRRPRVRGRGDYSEEIQNEPDDFTRLEAKIDHLEKRLVGKASTVKGAASTIGRTLGNFLGQGDLGAMAGSQLAKYLGHGDYKVKGNSLMQGKLATGATFANDGRRGTRVTEREFIGNITSGAMAGASSVFTVQQYGLNPTNSDVFPWLSQFAALFDQWEPHGIVFEFISTSSEYNGTSQALGAVVMATDYDPYDTMYISKQEMENSDYACSTKPSLNLVHGIECDVNERPTPVLYTSTDNGAPRTSFSLGNFSLATQGCSSAGTTLGELWVAYDITFYKKQIRSDLDAYASATGVAQVGFGMYSGVSALSNRGIDLQQSAGDNTSLLRFGAPGLYQVSYYLVTQSIGDNFNLTPSTGSQIISTRQVSIIASTVMYETLVRITIPGAIVNTGLKLVATSAWSLGVSIVNTHYTF